jgi:hypothetical protein
LRSAFADEYPIVIATTRRAPGIAAGLPTGISKNLQLTPTAKLINRPIMNFILLLRPTNLLKVFETLREYASANLSPA